MPRTTQTIRLTTAQALVRFLAAQHVERDGERTPFFAGCLGIFGHGNLAGIGQALQQYHGTPNGLRYVQARNEQAMVHTAIAAARHGRRRRAWACTSSIGPGATNMVTGAATATINRLPVLLLPGDTFATRRVDPALQQLEHGASRDTTVNDCLRPVSRYWDRIVRPEQLVPATLEAMRVLTDPAEVGAVTLCLPQDVQAEAFDWPVAWLRDRAWAIEAAWPEEPPLTIAVELIRDAERPVIVCGGGAAFAGATFQLAAFATMTGIPVVETQAGTGVLPSGHPRNLGAAGATGTLAANRVLRDADLLIGLGTAWDDFTTGSRTMLGRPGARVININVDRRDALKLDGVPMIADAGAGLESLWMALGFTVEIEGDQYRLPDVPLMIDADYDRSIAALRAEWHAERDRLTAPDPSRVIPSQAEVIGAVNRASIEAERAGRGATVVCAAGSLPGDLHKLWRTADDRGYHVEYGFSCMGYEVAGGLGVALSDPERDVYVMVGDGSWLMMSSEIVTAVQEGIPFTTVLIDNHGFGSIGALSTSLGSAGFGTRYQVRVGEGDPGGDGGFTGAALPVDYAANAASLGAHVVACRSIAELEQALADTRSVRDRPVVITIECDPTVGVPGYDSWWDVPVAEVSEMASVVEARASYEEARAGELWWL